MDRYPLTVPTNINHERRLLHQQVHMVVVTKLTERQQLIPVVLVVTCEIP
jgi:hypothetical protein